MAIELKLSATASSDASPSPLDKSGVVGKEGASQASPAMPLTFMTLLNQLDVTSPGTYSGVAVIGLNDKSVVALNAEDDASPASTKDATNQTGLALDSSAILAQMQMAWYRPTPQTAAAAMKQDVSSAGTALAIDAQGSAKNVLTTGTISPKLTDAPEAESAAGVIRSQDAAPPFTRLLKAEHLARDTVTAASDRADVVVPSAAKLASDFPVVADALQVLSNAGGQPAHSLSSRLSLNAASHPERSGDASISLSAGVTWGESFRQLSVLNESEKGSAPLHSNLAAVERRTDLATHNAWDFSTKFAVALSAHSEATATGASTNAGFEQQVANQVSMWVTQNVQSAELKLDAFGADPVEVSIALTGNEAQVQFRSDVAETRDMLSRAATQLDAALQREGFVLSGVSVGTSAQGRDTPRDTAVAGGSSKTASRRGDDSTTPAAAVRLNAMAQPSRGAVDLFV